MNPVAEFRAWLADAPVLRRMAAERFADYGRRLGEILADPGAQGEPEDCFRLAQKVYSLGDESSALMLALHARERGEGLVRDRATARAGRCLYELGMTGESIELLEAGYQELHHRDPDSPLLPVIDNMLANALEMDGRDVEAEHHYQRARRAVHRLTPERLAAAGFSGREGMDHPITLNLCEIGLKRIARLESPARERLLASIREELALSLARADLPVEFLPKYVILRAHALLLAGQLDEVARLLTDLEAPCRVSPDMHWCLPLLLRERGRLHARRGDSAAAYRDLRGAMHESLHAVQVIEERQVVVEIFEVLAEMHGPATGAGALLAELGTGGAGRGLLEEVVDCLEQKDWYTGNGHSRAVATLAARMARALPDAPEPLDPASLEAGALLHDIGKLTIPWALLNKTAPLSGWERRYLQSHAEAGGRLLEIVGLHAPAAVARAHHRHFSGGGFPDARPIDDPYTEIVAVADAFEAMITPTRKYRTARRVDDAVAEILRCTPGQFSPRAAQALASLYPQA